MEKQAFKESSAAEICKSLESDTGHDFDKHERLIQEKALENKKVMEDIAKLDCRIEEKMAKIAKLRKEYEAMEAEEEYQKQESIAINTSFDLFGRTKGGLLKGRAFHMITNDLINNRITKEDFITKIVEFDFSPILDTSDKKPPKNTVVLEQEQLDSFDAKLYPEKVFIGNDDNGKLSLECTPKGNLHFDLIDLHTPPTFADAALPSNSTTTETLFVDYSSGSSERRQIDNIVFIAPSIPSHAYRTTTGGSPRNRFKESPQYHDQMTESGRRTNLELKTTSSTDESAISDSGSKQPNSEDSGN